MSHDVAKCTKLGFDSLKFGLFRATCSSVNVKAVGGGGGEREKREWRKVRGRGEDKGKGRERWERQRSRDKSAKEGERKEKIIFAIFSSGSSTKMSSKKDS